MSRAAGERAAAAAAALMIFGCHAHNIERRTFAQEVVEAEPKHTSGLGSAEKCPVILSYSISKNH
jgi:hypothetical protein